MLIIQQLFVEQIRKDFHNTFSIRSYLKIIYRGINDIYSVNDSN